MSSRSALRHVGDVLRAALVLTLAAQLACVPKIVERCRLVTAPTPPPALPAGFAELDALLLRRATDMTLAARELNSSLVVVFHRDFAEQVLPDLCGKLEQARELAMAGRTAEAGRKYQALLVASQVLAFAVAVQSAAQYADARGQPGGQITQILEVFADQAAPILEAALTEDPREIERALNARPEVFTRWAKYLEQWPRRVDAAYRQVEVARVVWDIAFLVAATYEAAGAAADIVAEGGPPMPPLPALATSGGAAAAGLSGTAALEMAAVLRKLIALGGLDAGVVAALSGTLGPPASSPAPLGPAQMAADPAIGSVHPTTAGQPSSAGRPAAEGVPQATNPRLQGALRELFRASDEIPGGTAGAIRHELKTGELVGGKSHILKGQERAAQLERILKQESLTPSDRATAERVLQDLRDALAGR